MVAANDGILYFPAIKSATFWKIAPLEKRVQAYTVCKSMKHHKLQATKVV